MLCYVFLAKVIVYLLLAFHSFDHSFNHALNLCLFAKFDLTQKNIINYATMSDSDPESTFSGYDTNTIKAYAKHLKIGHTFRMKRETVISRIQELSDVDVITFDDYNRKIRNDSNTNKCRQSERL